MLALAATPAAAQFEAVEGLFENVEQVTVFVQRGWVAGSENATGDGLFGAGTEVLINVASPGLVDIEFGLGASFLRGYGAAEPSLDLHTALRAVPTVSVYLSPRAALGPFSFYGGLSLGLVELWNAQAYDEDGNAWDLEAATFEYGASAGVYGVPVDGFGLFLEGGYRDRRFGSLRWTDPVGEGLPEAWPRSLDLSGYFVQAGVQLRVEEPEEEKEEIVAPAPAGVWALERIDGVALPAVLDSTAGAWSHAVHGVLRLEPEGDGSGTYTLELHLRRASGRGTVALEPRTEAGRYSRDGSVLAFTPAGGGGAQRAERLAGRLYLTWNGHVLVFAPGTPMPDDEDG
jgi:hypothetical protein